MEGQCILQQSWFSLLDIRILGKIQFISCAHLDFWPFSYFCVHVHLDQKLNQITKIYGQEIAFKNQIPTSAFWILEANSLCSKLPVWIMDFRRQIPTVF